MNTARNATLGLAISASLSAGLAAPAAAALPGQSGSFSISTQVPRAGGPLPLYRLSRTAAPSQFVAGIVRGAGLSLRAEGSRLAARDAHGVLRAYSDPARGEAQIFPDLTLRGGNPDAAAMNRTKAAVFSRGDIVPNDATTIGIGAETVVASADATAPASGGQSATQPQQLFTYVSALRRADGLPVYGIGSKATVGIGPDGSVRALVRRWQAAQRAGSVAPALGPAQVVAAIRGQLAGYLAAGDTVDVKRVALAYYDGDAAYLQPIYYFEAGIRTPGGDRDAAVGYVPFGKSVEPIVSLAAPSTAQAQPTGVAGGAGRSGVVSDGGSSEIALGEYANDDGQTVSQGNYLLAGLQTYGGGIFGPPIERTQYYWATPAAYIGSSAQSYINAVHVAHTPPHGNWWLNTTNGRGEGYFYIQNIGTGGNPGYGAASGGKLATWIMDSCENAPSYYDLQYTTGNGNAAFTYWWPVFQGLHHLLAYRSMMYINQTPLDQQFGEDAETGSNVASAWYNDNASWYAQYSGTTYLDTNINAYVHYGRVSIFQDTRNENETIYDVQGQSAASNLNNSWMNN